MTAVDRILFKPIDNAPLVVFRIFFGLLIFLESVGAIFTGWVDRTMIEPRFTFTFIGFDFLQPLPGYGMYVWYLLMGVLGIGVMLGYRYRWSMIGFTLLWAGVYFMQKSSYNNHYYLLFLVNIVMCFLPAASYASFDVKSGRVQESLSMPAWCRWVIVLQLWIVYTYASLAKLYPHWLDLSFIEQLMKGREHFFLVGDLLQQPWVHKAIAVFGILYDLLVIPLFFWKPTRKFAFIASVFFHLFNSFILHIGIFPYLALAFTLFFFPPDAVRRWFLKRKPLLAEATAERPSYRNALYIVASLWFALQIGLPLRHLLIEKPVLYTEEGHRLSWRMMLRTKSGMITFKVVDKATGKSEVVRLRDWLSEKQQRVLPTKPDMIWQFAQRLKAYYKETEGRDVGVYASKSRISINGRPMVPFVDPSVDLAAQPWHWFTSEPWILPLKNPEVLEARNSSL